MRADTVIFHREHELLRSLLAGRLLRRDWHGAAARFVERLPAGEAVDLHVYLEARCDQSCEFCAQPAQRDRPVQRAVRALDQALDGGAGDLVRSGALAALLAACARRAPPVRLTLTGHDWLAHPARDEILAVLEALPGLSKRLQGPSTALADPALARRVAALPGLVTVSVTAQGGSARVHDRAVGRAGAFDALCAAVARLTAAGAAVDVNTVLTRDALAALPEILRWAHDHQLPVTLSAFVPEPAHPSPRSYLPRLSALRATLAEHSPAIVRGGASLVGLPRCVAPPVLWPRSFGAAMNAAPAAAPCARCAERGNCPGAPRAYLDAFGDAELAPVDPSSPAR